MIKIGFLDIFKRNKELEIMLDLDLLQDVGNKAYLKKLSLDICINFLARTISQSEFRVKQGKKFIRDDMYYHLNLRPSKNKSAADFWQTVIYKMIFDNECLVIQADDGDLLIADSFYREEYAVFNDVFSSVIVNDYEFKRKFSMDEVLYFQYNNRALVPLIDQLFVDYGELFGKIINMQKRKGQIRSTAKLDSILGKTKEARADFQNFIDKMYAALQTKDTAIVPEQKGIEYKEHSNNIKNAMSVDEVNIVSDGFLKNVAMALGIPFGLLKGDLADVEKQTGNFMTFAVNPIVKKISDELNGKLLDKKEYLEGKRIDIRTVTHKNIFDLAVAIDKLIASGAFTGNEMRDAAGWEQSDDEKLDKHYITKNYTEMEGGEEGETQGEH